MADDARYRRMSTRDLEALSARSDLKPDELQLVVDELARRIADDLLEGKRVPSGERDADLGTDLGREQPAPTAPTPTLPPLPPRPPRRPAPEPPPTQRMAGPPPTAQQPIAQPTPTPTPIPTPTPLAAAAPRRPAVLRRVFPVLVVAGLIGGGIAAANWPEPEDDDTVFIPDDTVDDFPDDTEVEDTEVEVVEEEEFTGISDSTTLSWVAGGVTYTAEIETDGEYGWAQVSYERPDGCDCGIDEDLTLTYTDGSWFYIGSDPTWVDSGESAADEYSPDAFRLVETADGEYWFDAVCDTQGCYPT